MGQVRRNSLGSYGLAHWCAILLGAQWFSSLGKGILIWGTAVFPFGRRFSPGGFFSSRGFLGGISFVFPVEGSKGVRCHQHFLAGQSRGSSETKVATSSGDRLSRFVLAECLGPKGGALGD